MADNSIFIDTNILVYANNTLSPFCEIARRKLQDVLIQYDIVWISRQVLREFAVIATREMLSAGNLDFEKLSGAIQQFEQDFQIAEDSKDVTSRLISLLKETNSSGKQVHDANIVATMLASNIQTILTHNISDFQRFSTLVEIMPLIAV
jgi:predicted nucleic acid-binding protein